MGERKQSEGARKERWCVSAKTHIVGIFRACTRHLAGIYPASSRHTIG